MIVKGSYCQLIIIIFGPHLFLCIFYFLKSFNLICENLSTNVGRLASISKLVINLNFFQSLSCLF